MTRVQHLGVIIGLYGVWYGFSFLNEVFSIAEYLWSAWNTSTVLSWLLVEIPLLATVIVGRYRLARFLLRKEADEPVVPSRALLIGGQVLMAFHLVERGFWNTLRHTDYRGLEVATQLSAPSVLCGAALLLFARPIATVLTGRR